MKKFTVGEVAKLARVSVRTLHHYDEIHLVEPSARSSAGYRLYTETDLERLQQVLFFREAVAERSRLFIDTHFYPCSRAMHAGVGEMYVDDPRFAATYEARRQGLAEYVRDAIRANPI